ncbi:MAG: hypothetical protein QM790_09120 [Nibricoccus sp.]
MRPHFACAALLITTATFCQSQTLDSPPGGRPGVRAVFGGGSPVPIDVTTPMPDLVKTACRHLGAGSLSKDKVSVFSYCDLGEEGFWHVVEPHSLVIVSAEKAREMWLKYFETNGLPKAESRSGDRA